MAVEGLGWACLGRGAAHQPCCAVHAGENYQGSRAGAGGRGHLAWDRQTQSRGFTRCLTLAPPGISGPRKSLGQNTSRQGCPLAGLANRSKWGVWMGLGYFLGVERQFGESWGFFCFKPKIPTGSRGLWVRRSAHSRLLSPGVCFGAPLIQVGAPKSSSQLWFDQNQGISVAAAQTQQGGMWGCILRGGCGVLH